MYDSIIMLMCFVNHNCVDFSGDMKPLKIAFCDQGFKSLDFILATKALISCKACFAMKILELLKLVLYG